MWHRPWNFLTACFFLLMCYWSSHRVVAQQPVNVLRILSYNIHHGRGMDDKVDLERIAKVITDCKADLVALQEVDVGTERTGRVDQVAELGRLTDLHAQFVKQIDYEGGSYGQAILSRWPICEPLIVWLPGDPPREQRIVGIVETMGTDSPRLAFGTTHLHHNNSTFRLQQARKLQELLQASTERVTIIAGDFNAEPESEVMRQLASTCTIFGTSPILTFPADAPTKQIDFVIGSTARAFEVQSVEVSQSTTASDHLPLLAVVKLVPGAVTHCN